MLTRNSQIEKLLEEGDFNVRVTIYDPSQVSKDPEKQKAAWLEAIRDSIGGGIVNSTERYAIWIKTPEESLIDGLLIAGKIVATTIDYHCEKPQPIRISLKPISHPGPSRVWIIA